MKKQTKPLHTHKWRQGRRKNILLLFVLLCGMAATFLLSVFTGSAEAGLSEVVRCLAAGPEIESGSPVDYTTHTIIWSLRLPRVLMSLLCGAGLGLAGAAMQGILRNPLASPYTLGISSAAGFGASLAIVLDVGIASVFSTAGYLLIISNSFFFSILVLGIVLLISRTKSYRPSTMILAGISMMYLFSAGTSLLQYLATNDQLAKIVFWLMGSLMSVTWKQLTIISVFMAVVFPLLMRLSWSLNILSCGEEVAQSLGVHPRFVMVSTALLASVVTAGLVSFCGVIGFIGLVAPHIVRMMVGGDHRLLLPASAMSGSVILALSDTIARTVLTPMELPIGVITSFIGVPFFISILIRRKGTSH